MKIVLQSDVQPPTSQMYPISSATNPRSLGLLGAPLPQSHSMHPTPQIPQSLDSAPPKHLSRAETFDMMDGLDPFLSQGFRLTPYVSFSAGIFDGPILVLDEYYDPTS